jgi:hypothetical protein
MRVRFDEGQVRREGGSRLLGLNFEEIWYWLGLISRIFDGMSTSLDDGFSECHCNQCFLKREYETKAKSANIFRPRLVPTQNESKHASRHGHRITK